MARVFVYGTLKKGQQNHYRLEKAMAEGQVTFVGRARTVDKFPLIIASRFNIPYLLWAKDKGNQVHGEVYDVDDAMLKQLDILEEVPFHYQKENFQVELLNKHVNGQNEHKVNTTECLVYTCKLFKPEMLDRPSYADYDSYGSHGLVHSMAYKLGDIDYRYEVMIRPENQQS